MYTVAVKRQFLARHYLIGGDWGAENDPHAHQYVVEVEIQRAELDEHGYLVDIVKIESALDEAVDYFRDQQLNDLPEFQNLNPSLEHFSRIMCQRLLRAIEPPGPGTFTIKLWENENNWAAFHQAF
ncbi:MAG: 6-carboxytetrahydropterin synthase [Candidatus Marinimicrobia bacterium]|nr:6-carboxytetrahydropterin synthase [Candidatus Neomarinimicrobiota bacterium]MCF7901985.1 6-carboxytetrahydropterin synthase [Candidatus Neomarinimicrobiota bacterium]